jgi:DNA-binding PadR family transcriptional regulator
MSKWSGTIKLRPGREPAGRRSGSCLLSWPGRQFSSALEMPGELGRLFSPGYAPSPGSVYPAISALSRSGLIGAGDDNGKRRYQLTPAGGEALAIRQGQLSAIEARCGVYLRDHSEVEAELRRLETAVTAVSFRVEPAALLRILRSAPRRGHRRVRSRPRRKAIERMSCRGAGRSSDG